MSIQIIALGHRRRTGKDTFVKLGLNHLKSSGIKNCHRLSFFEKIKDISHKIWNFGGIEDSVYYENHLEKKDEILAPIGKSPREIWIEFGESINKICPITLCELAFQNLKDGIYLVSDLRRDVEADYVKKFGGKVIRIDNSRIEKYDDPVDSNLANYNDWDDIIENEGTLKEFNKTVIACLERHLDV
jgi:hypothetical protein